jgi:ankyrin repeat protein
LQKGLALANAIIGRHLDVLQFLIEECQVPLHFERSIAIELRCNWTLLHYAALCGDLDIVKYLTGAPEFGLKAELSLDVNECENQVRRFL